MGQPGRTEAAHPQSTTPAKANPPLPSSVHRAVLFMRVGAWLATANGLVTAVLGMVGWHDSPQAVTSGSPNANGTAFELGYVIAPAIWFLLQAGLWLWMAHANKAGKGWARITGTVFFGVSCLVVLGSVSADALSCAGLSGAWALVPILITVLDWILGLLAVILLWNKKSAPHFAPTPMPYPGPGPGYYRPASLPNTTVDAAPAGHPAADPWSVPGGQA